MEKSTRTYKKKSSKKKQNATYVHPYLECIQNEIKSLQDELNNLEEQQKIRELSLEEQSNKQITKACLERYKLTLTKFTDSSMKGRISSYTDTRDKDIKQNNEQQILSLLQFFYIVRLGQLGLFEMMIDHVTKSKKESAPTHDEYLKATTDLCDQLVGASVFLKTDPSPQIKSAKRQQVFSLLKKLDAGVDEIIPDQNQITFKDIRKLIKHIWDNTVPEEQALTQTNDDQGDAQQFDVLKQDNKTINSHHQEEQSNDINKDQDEPAHKKSSKQKNQKKKSSNRSSSTSSDDQEQKNDISASTINENAWGNVTADCIDKSNEQFGWNNVINNSMRCDSWDNVNDNTMQRDGWGDITNNATNTESMNNNNWSTSELLNEQKEPEKDKYSAKEEVPEVEKGVAQEAAATTQTDSDQVGQPNNAEKEEESFSDKGSKQADTEQSLTSPSVTGTTVTDEDQNEEQAKENISSDAQSMKRMNSDTSDNWRRRESSSASPSYAGRSGRGKGYSNGDSSPRGRGRGHNGRFRGRGGNGGGRGRGHSNSSSTTTNSSRAFGRGRRNSNNE
ncbi:MAG: hypothetical protein EXX96DRAFT_619476 [Benjaminiella poitrasii]|nr:MAG: hypothetical protein EXX96DRAFT_619476 [Benjaminiella poitrasii]